MEGDVFRTIIPLNEAATLRVGPGTPDSTHDGTHDGTHDVKLSEEQLAALLAYCKVPRSRQEMQDFCEIKTREYFRKNILKPMLARGLVRETIPEKPRSKNQRYIKN